MMRPRWNKITSDLFSHKGRSLLVIASIAVGLFAIGMVATSYTVLAQDIRSGYQAVNPANIQVMAPYFTSDFVDHVRHLPGVAEAEGARNISLQIRTSSGEWEAINLKAADFGKHTPAIAQPALVEGVWPPDDKELVLDVNRLKDTGASLGDTVEIKLPSGKIRRMQLVGVVRDQTIGATYAEGGFFLANIQGYVTEDSLGWLEQPSDLNTLYVTVGQQPEDAQSIRALADVLLNDFEANGYKPSGAFVRLSSEHPNVPYVDAMAAVIYALGFLVVFLSGFLITNTFSALLNQQVEQIGVMKTIGASRGQIIALYVVLILVFSSIALAIAIPTARLAAYALLAYLAEAINFTLASSRPVPEAVLLQGIVALVVPQIAGIIPILQGTRISVRQALSGTTTAPVEHRGFFNRNLKRFRLLSRPMRISLRNTFRRRGRLVLTLLTLTLGGATFIATFNMRNSLETYIDRLGRYFLADINLTFNQPYRIERVKRDLLQVPGVAAVEGWAGASANLVNEEGQAGEVVQLVAPPASSRLIEPMLLKGRWIAADDENALALSEIFLEIIPGLDLGDTIRLKIGQSESDWVVVGFFQFAGRSSGLFAYANYDYVARETGMYGRAFSYRIVGNGEGMSIDQQEALAKRVDAHLAALDYQVKEVSTGLSLQETTSEGLNILTTFLLIMSFLLAAVGSIGLAGTMGLNVMERTQEIGVMRAIGGSNRAITAIVLAEGVLIGLISWVLSCVAALPISKQLADVIFQIIFDRDAAMAFTFSGNAIWLALVLLLAVLASIVPAYNASRLTIREVLAYE